MGFLLKIILFGVACYALWKTLSRWKGLYDRFIGNPPQQPPAPRPQAPPQNAPQNPPQQQAQTQPTRQIEDTYACKICGVYVSASARRCDRSDCPQPA
jgi:hypothetical protein